MKKIAKINAERQSEEDRLNQMWENSEEWKQLREDELQAIRIQRAAEKRGALKIRMSQTYRSKKHRIEKIRRGDGKGVDSWRYVQHAAEPLLWPECHRRLAMNLNFILMEDNAAPHQSDFTTTLPKEQGNPKVSWPPNSPDFNPIEQIWAIMKFRILRR